MKQGSGKNSSDPRDPTQSKGVNPGAVAQIGQVVGQNPRDAVAPSPEDRGKADRSVHKHGSQGRH